jgi:hypothetical protein
MTRTNRAGRFMEARTLAYVSEVYLRLGELEKARKAAQESVLLSQQRGAKNFECGAHIALARALIAAEGQKAKDAIEASLGAAMKFVEELGAKYWAPFVHVERARLASLTGDGAAHARELHEAHRLFAEMEATGRAARIARELDALESPPT